MKILAVYLYNIIDPSSNPTAINVKLECTHKAVAGTALKLGIALLILTHVGYPCLSFFDKFHTFIVGLQPGSSSFDH